MWHGNYYALEVMQHLGLPDGAIRVGIVHYNTEDEVDGLLAELVAVPERDYSGTPLSKKLGAKPGAEVVVFFTTRGTSCSSGCPAEGGARAGRRALDRLAEEGARRSGPTSTSTRRPATRASRAGLVDNKSCSIDDGWQALRFVYG